MPRPRRETAASGEKLLAGPPRTYLKLDPMLERLAAGSCLLRIYAREPYGGGPLTFRRFGPLNRFDHHRSGKSGPRRNRDRAILYAGSELVCCVGETFGDHGAVTRAGYHLVRLVVAESLELLDLRGPAATGALTIPAVGGVGERRITQAWGRWWYEHPQLAHIDGLLYSSGQTAKDAVALFERANGKLAEDVDWELSDEAIRDDLEVAADELNLPIL